MGGSLEPLGRALLVVAVIVGRLKQKRTSRQFGWPKNSGPYGEVAISGGTVVITKPALSPQFKALCISRGSNTTH